MNYQYIVNPKTGRKVKSNGKLGIRILKKYLQQMGGASFSVSIRKAMNNSRARRQSDISSKSSTNSPGEEKKTSHSSSVISNGEYDAPGDIAVLGDIHGDYGALISALSVGGLIRPKEVQLKPEQTLDGYSMMIGTSSSPYQLPGQYGWPQDSPNEVHRIEQEMAQERITDEEIKRRNLDCKEFPEFKEKKDWIEDWVNEYEVSLNQ